MADQFTALIEAKLDISQAQKAWASFKSQMESTPLKVKVDISDFNSSISNITKTLHQAGTSAGKAFQSGLNSQIKNTGNIQAPKFTSGKQPTIEVTISKNEIKRINDLINTKSYDAKISTINTKLSSYLPSTNEYKDVEQSLNNVRRAYDDLRVAKENFDKSKSNENSNKLIESYEKLSSTMKLAENQMKILSNEQDKIISPSLLSSTKKGFASYLENNTKAVKAYKDEINALEIQLNQIVTVSDKANFDVAFRNLQTKAIQEGNVGKSWIQEFGRAFKQIGQFTYTYGIIRQAPQAIAAMYQEVVKVDTAMTNLYKVTDETNAVYEAFLNNASSTAKDLGRNISSYITQTSEWAKLGYNLSDSAGLAKVSSIYANVGEVTDETAVSDMVTAMKAYNIEASDAIRIADSYNEVANKFATEASDLGEGISNAASSLSVAGNDFDQSVAMITGMSEITQEAGEAGNALKILSMRIRGYDEETESYSNNIEDLSGKIADLTKTASTPGGISLFTDATKETYKSTYQLMSEISEIYSDLTDKAQAELLEVLAGKNRGNQISALIQAFQSGQVQNAYQTSITAEGSAMREQERWLDSLEAKQQQLSASFQELSMTVINSDFAKGLLDAVGATLDIVTELIDKFGILGPLISGIFGASTIRSFSKNFDKSMIITSQDDLNNIPRYFLNWSIIDKKIA